MGNGKNHKMVEMQIQKLTFQTFRHGNKRSNAQMKCKKTKSSYLQLSPV